MAPQSIAGDGNIQILIKDSPEARIEIDGKVTADLRVPQFRKQLDPDRNTDLDLLSAKYAITDLAGRETLWTDCLAWCDRPEAVSVRCITGRGGCGKTRFALELLHDVRARPGWDARFVEFYEPRPFDLWAKTQGPNHVLLVFDYAADATAPLAESLRRLANNPPRNPQRRLRILLLARTASWDEGWLTFFKPRSTIEESIRDLFDPREPIPLEPLGQSDRIAVFAQALKRAAAFANLPAPPAPDPILFMQKRAEGTLRDPLALVMAAVIGVRSGVPQALSLTRLELAYDAAGLLVSSRLDKAFPENKRLAHHMAAYITLCGGMSRDQARAALVVEARENNLGAAPDPGSFIDRLQAWFPGEKTDIGPIQPDIIGEAFLLGENSPRLDHPEDTILRAIAQSPRPVILSLIRTIQDVCFAEGEARTEPLTWLEKIIAKGEADDFSLLLAIESALPESTVVLRPQAVRVTQFVLHRLRMLATSLPPNGDLASTSSALLARILNNLAIRQSEAGLRTEALATAQEAVALRRELAERNRDAFAMDLARSQGTLGLVLASQGRFPEAAEALEEGLRAILPYAERYPQALTGLAALLLREYAAAAEGAKVKPDSELLVEAARILGPLSTNKESQHE